MNHISPTYGAYKPSKTRPRSYPTHCQHEGCKVKLSIYNLTMFCSSHESEHASARDSI